MVQMSIANNAVVSIDLHVKSVADSINFYTNVLDLKADTVTQDQKGKLHLQNTDNSKFPVVNLIPNSSPKQQLGDVSTKLSIFSLYQNLLLIYIYIYIY